MKFIFPTAKAFVGIAILFYGSAWLTAYLTGTELSYFTYWLGLILLLLLKLHYDARQVSNRRTKLLLICFGLIFGGLIVSFGWYYFAGPALQTMDAKLPHAVTPLSPTKT